MEDVVSGAVRRFHVLCDALLHHVGLGPRAEVDKLQTGWLVVEDDLLVFGLLWPQPFSEGSEQFPF